MEESFDQITFRASISEEDAKKIKLNILKFEERQFGLEGSLGAKRIEFDRGTLKDWNTTARAVLGHIGFKEGEKRLINPSDVLFLTVNSPEMENTLVAGVDDMGRTMRFITGEGFNLEEERDQVKRTYWHEIAHQLHAIVVDKPVNPQIPVRIMLTGFDKASDENHGSPAELVSTKKGVLREPLADLFSYFCSVEEGSAYHVLSDDYAREDSFLIAMLATMTDANESSVYEEFGRLFKAFCNRDYSWFKHLLQTFERHYEQKGFTKEAAKSESLEFARELNSIMSTEGKDVIDRPGGNKGWGYQLSDVSTKGLFFSTYEFLCNGLVDHGGYIRLKGLSTQLH